MQHYHANLETSDFSIRVEFPETSLNSFIIKDFNFPGFFNEIIQAIFRSENFSRTQREIDSSKSLLGVVCLDFRCRCFLLTFFSHIFCFTLLIEKNCMRLFLNNKLLKV